MTRVALVTGAARGIGAATVRRLAAEGYGVLALDWCLGTQAAPYPMPSRADLELLAEAGDVLTVVADVRDRGAIETAVADAVARWGRVDVAVAGAAVIAGGRKLWETSVDDLNLLWQIDFLGVWNTAAATVPTMLSGPDPSGCRFVAIASAAGSRGLFHLAGYTAVKHAVVGIVRGLAVDLIGTGVTAVAVSPGSTGTDMLDRTAQLYRDASIDDLVSHQLLGRALRAEEIADTIAFCCSPSGAALNGSVVHADGGFRG
jgi:SDR family mycofactocin-dependent oxidoreductase